MQLVPFDTQVNLPAYLATGQANADINKDVVRAPAFPTMSIKGKVFTLNKGGVKKVLMKPGEDDEIAQSIGVVILRSNMASKTFYLKAFQEGDSDNQRPDCYSHDGVAPSPNSQNPQAKKCAVCPHNQWGSRVGEGDRPGQERKGKACSDNARLAIAAPDKLDEPMLLRVPPASLKNLREAVKIIDQRKIPYNAVVMKFSFDAESASPLLKFKPIGLLGDAEYAKASEQYDGELVRSIVGLDDHYEEPAEPAPAVSSDELDAALAAREASSKAAAAAKAAAPAPTPTEPPAPPAAAPATRRSTKTKPATEDEVQAAVQPPAAAPAPKPAAAPSTDTGSLLGDLDALLGGTDD